MTHPVKIILAIALGISLVLLSAGTAFRLAHPPTPAPVLNFPLLPKKATP